jgi:hypothetical protein
VAIQTIQTQQEAFRQRLGQDAKFPIVGNFEVIDGIATLLQDIQTLLLTIPGERVGRPEFGCNLRNQIWENLDTAASDGAASISTALGQFEPRITVTNVSSDINRNTGLITFLIKFNIINTDTNLNLIFPFRNSQEISSQ